MTALIPSVTLAIVNGHPTTTSRQIAEHFGKQHGHVLRAIANLECSDEFRQSNFGLAHYLDEQGKPRQEYTLTRDGFTFLCMGFTGKDAAQWKEKYIAAFNAMEARCAQTKLDATQAALDALDMAGPLSAPEALDKFFNDDDCDIVGFHMNDPEACELLLDVRKMVKISVANAMAEHGLGSAQGFGRLPAASAQQNALDYQKGRVGIDQLRRWAKDNLGGKNLSYVEKQLEELDQVLQHGWSEINEAMLHMVAATAMLRRWKGWH